MASHLPRGTRHLYADAVRIGADSVESRFERCAPGVRRRAPPDPSRKENRDAYGERCVVVAHVCHAARDVAAGEQCNNGQPIDANARVGSIRRTGGESERVDGAIDLEVCVHESEGGVTRSDARTTARELGCVW